MMTKYYAAFWESGPPRMPKFLFRRTVEGDTQSDSYFKVGEWIPKPYSRLEDWFRGWGDTDFVEVTEAQANEVMEMFASGDVHALSGGAD